MITLYDYYRSTAAYRVRIALNYKKISYDKVNVDLLEAGGQQHTESYRKLNPQELVPALQINGQLLTQSLAILEYLEEVYPEPGLLPVAPGDKAVVRAMAASVACDIHPLNNLRVLQYLKNTLGLDETMKTDWYHHWLKIGFNALEEQLRRSNTTLYCFGEQPTFADICLVPQVFNALRFDFSMDDYPIISRINTHCLTLPAFSDAMP